jgi:hypothetical protein
MRLFITPPIFLENLFSESNIHTKTNIIDEYYSWMFERKLWIQI